MKKFLCHFILFLLALITSWSILSHSIKMRIQPYDYAMWSAKFDTTKNKSESFDLLIFGDSQATAAISPEVIGHNSFNLSLGGSSPLEARVLLQNYLLHHKAPKTIVLSFAQRSLFPKSEFFHHTLNFNLLPINEYLNLYTEIKTYPDFYDESLNFNLAKNKLSSKFFNAQNLYFLDWLISSNGLSPYQLTFNENLFDLNIYKNNQRTYEETLKNKGQHFFGNEQRDSSKINPEVSSKFLTHPILIMNLKKIISICNQNNIKIIFYPPPTNMIYKNYFDSNFEIQYLKFYEDLTNLSKNAFFPKKMPFYDATFFSDPDHANQNGMELYSKELKSYLDQVVK